MGVKPLKTLQLAFQLLECFTAENPKHTLAELTKLMKLPKTNVFRFLATLTALSYIEKDPASGQYYLSMRLFDLGSRALSNRDIRELGHRYLKELYEKTRQTVVLSVLEQTQVLHIDVIHSQEFMRASPYIGQRYPAHATAAGLAMLAFSPTSSIDTYLASDLNSLTPDTMTEADQVRAELHLIRDRGYAVNRGGGRTEILGIGTPLLGGSGLAEAALAIALPMASVDDKQLNDLITAILDVSRRFSRSLGYFGAAPDS
jgi:IclR family KDG regulon transcriptional repressor